MGKLSEIILSIEYDLEDGCSVEETAVCSCVTAEFVTQVLLTLESHNEIEIGIPDEH